MAIYIKSFTSLCMYVLLISLEEKLISLSKNYHFLFLKKEEKLFTTHPCIVLHFNIFDSLQFLVVKTFVSNEHSIKKLNCIRLFVCLCVCEY